jgi:hypothetical protein
MHKLTNSTFFSIAMIFYLTIVDYSHTANQGFLNPMHKLTKIFGKQQERLNIWHKRVKYVLLRKRDESRHNTTPQTEFL